MRKKLLIENQQDEWTEIRKRRSGIKHIKEIKTIKIEEIRFLYEKNWLHQFFLDCWRKVNAKINKSFVQIFQSTKSPLQYAR